MKGEGGLYRRRAANLCSGPEMSRSKVLPVTARSDEVVRFGEGGRVCTGRRWAWSGVEVEVTATPKVQLERKWPERPHQTQR